ncbi:MAG: DUF2213 domain-containing protein [Clostridia bacterium]|nr:DUF2213 domain-containing protein [Clostridia bacterium]
MHYYGTRLSENISRREPEGYLLCLNVPVARTGTQDYLPEELGLMPGSSFISVYRPEDEVFSPETMASFEGMPVTNDHPPEGVDIGNIRALQKGHAHNVRRGSGDESDLLLADLIITDPKLIDLILSGKREISCGYTYELCEENGQYIQRKIRGNHVAVVDAGRAGPRVSIKDNKPERSTNRMKKSLSKILARMAKDGDIDTVAEIIQEMIEPEAPAEAVAEEAAEEVAEAVEEVAEEPAAVVETPEGTTVVVDEATLADVISRLDRIITLLSPAAQDEDPVEEIVEAVEEAVEAAAEAEAVTELPEAAEEVAAIVEEILQPEGEGITEAVEGDACERNEPEVISTGDALRAALVPMRPVLAKMPLKQRRRVCADLAARLNGKQIARKGIYGAIHDAARRRPDEDPELGKRIMASRNPNYKN